MMIPEKEPLPFDTQNAHKAVLMSKGRRRIRARCHTAHRMMIPEKQPLPFDTSRHQPTAV